MIHGLIILGYLINIIYFGNCSYDCMLNVTRHPAGNSLPVILTVSGQEPATKRAAIHLKHGQNLIMLCLNKGNCLVNTTLPDVTATCVQGNILNINQINLNFEDVKCKKIVHASILQTSETCGYGKGTILSIGFSAPRLKFTQISICYDNAMGNTIYAEHFIVGQDIKYSSKINARPSFSTQGLGTNIIGSVAYKKSFQKATFNKILGSAVLATRYINDNSYLAHGHLAPNADFFFASGQYASFFYVNTCPQWQAINNGNWKRVEMYVRKSAEYYNTTLRIITGTHGALELNDIDNRPRKICLQEDKLSVPKYIWKIVYNDESKRGIALVVLNNPFLDNRSQEADLCPNVCSTSGWSKTSWSNVGAGYTICCKIEDLFMVVPTIPHLFVNGILRGIL